MKYIVPVLALAFAAIQAEGSDVVVLTAAGPVGTFMAEYVERGITEAEARGAAAVVLRLDTPGGLDSAMRRIVQRTMNARVPVIAYVAPRGARAASAGCLIVLAAHVAAMAPGTNIGAAHPRYITGEDVSAKVLNDAAAYARSLAAANKRNGDWAEKAVRESVSATDEEALSLHVIETIEPELDKLLAQVDGRVVRTTAGNMELRTRDARQLWLGMNWRERVFSVLADPTLAYLLLVAGAVAIIFEIVIGGSIVAGGFGAIALFLGMCGLASLPVRASGATLLVLAIVLFVAELKVASHGLLTVAGVISFVLGSWLLFPRTPGYRISLVAIVAMAACWIAVLAVVIRLVLKARRAPVSGGTECLVGAQGVAKTDLAPRGVVFVGGEDWNAEADGSPVTAGNKVEVLAVDALTLRVRRLDEERRE